MIYSEFSEFHEAASNWYLERLYKALAFHKKAPLSEFEKKCLCGLLCRRDISYIARLVNWSSKAAVRTELSRGLYLYIKALTGQTKIRWNCIPDLLESEYRRQKNSFSQSDNSSPSDINFEYRANSIIATISEQKRRKIEVTEEDFNEFSTDAETLIKYGDLKCKFNEYITAIEAYKEAV